VRIMEFLHCTISSSSRFPRRVVLYILHLRELIKPINIAVQWRYTLAVLLGFSKGAERYSTTQSFVLPPWFVTTLPKKLKKKRATLGFKWYLGTTLEM
jgi:hypothetical protein